MKKAYTNATRKGATGAMSLQGNKGASTKVRMPLCTYGAACTRKDCVYRHPASRGKGPVKECPPAKSEKVSSAYQCV